MHKYLNIARCSGMIYSLVLCVVCVRVSPRFWPWWCGATRQRVKEYEWWGHEASTTQTIDPLRLRGGCKWPRHSNADSFRGRWVGGVRRVAWSDLSLAVKDTNESCFLRAGEQTLRAPPASISPPVLLFCSFKTFWEREGGEGGAQFIQP